MKSACLFKIAVSEKSVKTFFCYTTRMSKNFWRKLKKPILVLAPMANVTDAAFRRVIAKYGKPDVMWTEFVSADGLCSAGAERLLPDLWFTESERPIVAQLFTAKPEKMEEAAALAQRLGFDGIDINMGCPDRGVERQGAGAALIKTPKLARDVIRAAKKGAPTLPVSVKTRLGYNQNVLDKWLPELLAENPAAITIHLRTRKEMSAVPAHFEELARAVAIRDKLKSTALILGNGDAIDVAHAKKLAREHGADGYMLGRAIFGNPWLFSEKLPTPQEKLRVLLEHTKLFEKLFSGPRLPARQVKSFEVIKKHFKAYITGWDGAKDLRGLLMACHSSSEVAKILKSILHCPEKSANIKLTFLSS